MKWKTLFKGCALIAKVKESLKFVKILQK